MKKYNLIFSLFVLLLAVNVISCQDDAESFDSNRRCVQKGCNTFA